MRAIFGVVSLLIAVAIVGLLAARQLKATGQLAGGALPADPAPASAPAPATVREQSQQLQQRVKTDVVKALEQGAAARSDEAAK